MAEKLDKTMHNKEEITYSISCSFDCPLEGIYDPTHSQETAQIGVLMKETDILPR